MGRSLATRALMAVLLMVFFYVLAAWAAALLVWLGIALFKVLPEVHGRGLLVVGLAAVACLGAAVVVAWSVAPRIDRFEAPGPELFADDEPELFAEIERLGQATGQAPPRHVYLVPQVNAFVTQRGGWMGMGSRRVMGIGLPLLELLTVSQLRGVVAHELGHFHGGDTKLGPWIYKTRGAIGRTIDNLAAASETTGEGGGYAAIIGWIFALVQWPFSWFGTAFMRITQAISRAQEYSADALAARVAGRRAMIEGLQRVVVGAPAFSAYFGGEVAPLVEAGFRPPILAGFNRFLGQESLAGTLDELLASELESAAGDPYDSHPPLRERIAALETVTDAAEVELDDRRAIELIEDREALEQRLLRFMTDGAALEEMSWEQVVDRVYAPAWRETAAIAARAFAGVAFADVPTDLEDLDEALRTESGDDADHVDDEVVIEWAIDRVASAMAIQLRRREYAAVVEPGAPVALRSGELEVEPWNEVRAYIEGETGEDAWRARCAELELAEIG